MHIHATHPHRPAARRPRISRPALGNMLLIVLVVILFVPKVNVLALPGSSVQAKPEDIAWLLLLPWILVQGNFKLRSAAHWAWFALLLYLLTSALWHPSNLLMVMRLLFYSFPFLYGMSLTDRQCATIRNVLRRFLYVFAVIAALQYFTPFPFFHTGELLFGPAERPSGIFGNGVEFALVAFFSFWLLHLMGERSAWPWFAALAVTLLSGTRMATLLLAFGGLVFMYRWSPMRVMLAGTVIALCASAALVMLGSGDSGEARFAQVDPLAVFGAFRELLSTASASTGLSMSEGYCFEFDDTLADDQSLAMRLSKLLFVIENVLLGSYPLGFGLGQCIGDAGDNLYVRVLSDAGLPYLAGLLAFLAALLFIPVRDATLRKEWRIFLFSLCAISFFYDTFYISRVAPLIFASIAVVSSPHARVIVPRRAH